MTDHDGAIGAVVIAAVLIASALMMPMVPGGQVPETEATPTPQPGQTYEPATGDPQELDSLRTVPESSITQLSDDRGDDGPPEPTGVRASAGTQTMQIATTTVDGDPALVLSDNRTHDGRWVSVSTKWLQEVHGSVPSTVTIQHESGDTYTEQVRVRDDSAAFYVRGFSSNTVTFSGSVEITGDAAGDGAQFSYDVADLDSASDVTVNMTGVLNTEAETVSKSGVADGGTVSVSVAGNTDPVNAQITFNGTTIQVDGTLEYTYTKSGDTIEDIAVDTQNNRIFIATGNEIHAIDGSDGSQLWTYTQHSGGVTGVSVDASDGVVYTSSNDATAHAIDATTGGQIWTYSDDSSYLKSVEVDASRDIVYVGAYDDQVHALNGGDGSIKWTASPSNVRAYAIAVNENSNEVYVGGYGDTVAALDGADGGTLWSYTQHTGSINGLAVNSSTGTVYSSSGDTEVHAINADGSQKWTYTGHSSAGTKIAVHGSTGVIYSAAEDDQLHAINPNGTQKWTFTGDSYWKVGVGVNPSSAQVFTGDSLGKLYALKLEKVTDSPSVDIDSDGTDEVSYSGELAEGETYTESVSLSNTDYSMAVSLVGGSVDVDVDFTEQTVTKDPGVELNGQTVSYTGTLADGNTVQRTINKSYIQEGTNTVNVSVGDGTLSADAPAPQVKFELTHDAADRQSVNYAAEKWTSRYNVSKSYASTRSNAMLTIPFDSSDVVSMRTVEVRFNESGGWSSMSSTNYELNGTELTADLSGAYGGDIPAGTTIEVRAHASKIKPINGTLTVVEATPVGEDLNTKVRVDDAGTNMRIETADGKIHYVHNASYEADDHWVVDQQGAGQRLHIPEAQAGDTLRVSTIPVEADSAGNVHITVANTSATEPAISVDPGATDGDPVDYTFLDAQDGTEYALYSQTHGIVRDSGTAQSPLTLSDDDSQETLKFLLSDSGSDGGSSDSSGGGAVFSTGGGDSGDWLPLIGVALALAGLVVASRNSDTVTNAGTNAADGVEGALAGIPVLGPAIGKLLSALIQGTAQLARALVENRTIAVALGGAIAWGAVQFGIVTLPQGALPVILLGGFAIGSLFALQRLDSFKIRYWAGVNAVALAGAAIVWSDTDIVQALVSSDVFPLLAVGAVAAVVLAVRAYREDASTPDQTTELVIETDGGEDK